MHLGEENVEQSFLSKETTQQWKNQPEQNKEEANLSLNHQPGSNLLIKSPKC